MIEDQIFLGLLYRFDADLHRFTSISHELGRNWHHCNGHSQSPYFHSLVPPILFHVLHPD